MKRAAQRISAAVFCLVLAGFLPVFFSSEKETGQESVATTRIGGVQELETAFEEWKTDQEHDGRGTSIDLALGWAKGLSSESSSARGTATLDLVRGRVAVTVHSPPESGIGDVWLVDNQPGPRRSVRPEPEDVMVRVGSLSRSGGVAKLETVISSTLREGFEVDLVVVTRAGESPVSAGILFGAPSLFQRLEARSRRGAGPFPSHASLRHVPSLFRSLGSTSAYAAGPTTNLGPLLVEGERLFFKETFGGNGRTCGSCHPAQNNFTIDPAFIATLPPSDPLFVAEFNPALSQNFENPKLMRELGLIQENLDGFENLSQKFVMRGVPPTLALRTSLKPAPGGADGTTIPPGQRTGWSGDGAPGGGTLRDFAVGAVTQHFPLSLRRIPGSDFRLPTDEELDAMEAFQLSLGRQADINVSTLVLKGPLPRRGKEIFLASDTQRGKVAAGKCNLCHANAGATFSAIPGGVNFNFDTGVEDLPDHPADLIVATAGQRPPDGGFGRGLHPRIPGAFGGGTFNTPSVIEAADTGPFFHNNAIETLEEAVGFYNSRSFNQSPSGAFLASQDSGGVGISLEPTQVRAVAAFLRVLNAVENIRASIALQKSVMGGCANPGGVLANSIAEQEDAIAVLDGARLHPKAVKRLREAIGFTKIGVLAVAIAKQEEARKDMVQ